VHSHQASEGPAQHALAASQHRVHRSTACTQETWTARHSCHPCATWRAQHGVPSMACPALHTSRTLPTARFLPQAASNDSCPGCPCPCLQGTRLAERLGLRCHPCMSPYIGGNREGRFQIASFVCSFHAHNVVDVWLAGKVCPVVVSRQCMCQRQRSECAARHAQEFHRQAPASHAHGPTPCVPVLLC
jgi:hypothetical protein